MGIHAATQSIGPCVLLHVLCRLAYKALHAAHSCAGLVGLVMKVQQAECGCKTTCFITCLASGDVDATVHCTSYNIKLQGHSAVIQTTAHPVKRNCVSACRMTALRATQPWFCWQTQSMHSMHSRPMSPVPWQKLYAMLRCACASFMTSVCSVLGHAFAGFCQKSI